MKTLSEYGFDKIGLILQYNCYNMQLIDNIINDSQPDTVEELEKLLKKITVLKYKITYSKGFVMTGGVQVIIKWDGCFYREKTIRKQYKLPLARGHSYMIYKLK